MVRSQRKARASGRVESAMRPRPIIAPSPSRHRRPDLDEEPPPAWPPPAAPRPSSRSARRRRWPGRRRTTCRRCSPRRWRATSALATPTVFAAFSAALLVSAALGPLAGRAIDRWGGRPVLIGHQRRLRARPRRARRRATARRLFVAWLVLGVGMGSGLYEAAFAALVRLYGRDSRDAITGITLIAGFASTVGWPLSALLEAHVGWRGACFAWAALHLVRRPAAERVAAASAGAARRRRRAAPPAAPPPAPAAPRRRGRAASCSPSCSPRPGSSARRWRRTCRGCCRRAARRWPPRSPSARWSARRRSAAGCSSSACCAASTRCCRRALAALMHPLGALAAGVVGAPAAAVVRGRCTAPATAS